MPRGAAAYQPLTGRRAWQVNAGLFRTVRLNLLGWLALLTLLAAMGIVAWAAIDSTWAGVTASAAGVLLAVVIDRVRWRNAWISLGMESEASAQHLVRLLAAQRVKAEVESVKWDNEEQTLFSVKVRHRDRKVVDEALAQLR